jgi:hypothetical protein
MTFTLRVSSDSDRAADTENTEIFEFVRRDIVGLRRQAENDTELIASNIGTLLQRVAGSSIQGIETLIVELQTLRIRLNTEVARVQREVVKYSILSQAALQSSRLAKDISSENFEYHGGTGARDARSPDFG